MLVFIKGLFPSQEKAPRWVVKAECEDIRGTGGRGHCFSSPCSRASREFHCARGQGLSSGKDTILPIQGLVPGECSVNLQSVHDPPAAHSPEAKTDMWQGYVVPWRRKGGQCTTVCWGSLEPLDDLCSNPSNAFLPYSWGQSYNHTHSFHQHDQKKISPN